MTEARKRTIRRSSSIAIVIAILISYFLGALDTGTSSASKTRSETYSSAEEFPLASDSSYLGIQTAPISTVFGQRFNLGLNYRISKNVFVGPKGVYRAKGPVRGLELGIRTTFVLSRLTDNVWLTMKLGVNHFDLVRDFDRRYHEGGMFTPSYDPHTKAGEYQGFMFEAGPSLIAFQSNNIYFDLGGGVEYYYENAHISEQHANEFLPFLEFAVGVAI